MNPPAIYIEGGRPKHQKQLQIPSRYAGMNCGPTTELVALEAVSNNELRPRRENRSSWLELIRRPMSHGPSWPATTLQNIEESVESAVVRRRMRDRGYGRPYGVVRKVTVEEAINLLKKGKFLHVAIDYGRLNNLYPGLSGAKDFNGGHAIGLYGHAFQGFHWTYLYDPLHDGRRAGIPKGVQKVRVRRYLKVAATWGNAGAGNAWVVVVS